MEKPNIDLSKETILRLCKGNVKLLPRFVVVDDVAWPWPDHVRVDNLGRLHIRKTTFLRTVATELPVKPGLWIRGDSQEYSIDLQPHQLEGGADQQKEVGRRDVLNIARPIAKQDAFGRYPGGKDYGKANSKADRHANTGGDDPAATAGGQGRGVRSTVHD